MSRKKKQLPLLEHVSITDVAAEGKAIAKVPLNPQSDDKFVVFIPFGAPGDVADIQIDRRKHSYAEGHIVSLVTPSEERVEPRCRHFGVCGGCKWQHLPYDMQLKCKQKQVSDALERIAKVEFPEIQYILGSDHTYAYRNKMEYTFANRRWRTWEEMRSGYEPEGPQQALGFHIPGAFDKVMHVEECLLQDDLGNRIRNFVFDYAVRHGYSFYNIKENHGLLRTLMIRISSTGETMAVIVFGEDAPTAATDILNAVAEAFPEITSLLYVVNLKLNDSIADLDVHVFRGREYIEEAMEGLRFRVSAKSFYQTNSAQAQRLYSVVRRFAGLDRENTATDRLPLAYDLYTGTGTIAQYVAKGCRKVIGIEYVAEAIADARLNSEVNHLDNLEFFAGDMKDVLTDSFVAEHGHPDIIIIDPPRAGMHPDVVEVVKRAAPDTIVYVSCNPSTQARDIALLNNLYRVDAVQPVDMFPHTHHVENVIRLVLRRETTEE